VDIDLSRAVWHKSAFSNGNGGNCVEVARNLPGIVAVRDSKDHDTGPTLTFIKDEWSAFVAGVKAGAFG
jgi:hypothetical protein